MQKIPLRSPNGPHLSVRAGFAIKRKSLKPIAALGFLGGASDLTRTGDLLITSEMHYRLCYTSIVLPSYYIGFGVNCQQLFVCVLQKWKPGAIMIEIIGYLGEGEGVHSATG